MKGIFELVASLMFILLERCEAVKMPSSVLDEISDFVSCNSDGFVSFVSTSEGNLDDANESKFCSSVYFQLAKTRELRTRYLEGEGSVWNQTISLHHGPPMMPSIDFPFFCFLKEVERMKSMLEILASVSRPRKSLMLVSSEDDELVFSAIRTALGTGEQNAHFFMAVWNKTALSLEWFQVLTVLHQKKVVINSLNFQPQRKGCIKEHFDLQGLKVMSISMTWKPYLTIENCDTRGKNCLTNEGLVLDSARYLEKFFNMTVHSYNDPSGDWGLAPKNGTKYDLSGTWEGVMGKVITQEYPISLNSWRHILKRHFVMDLVPFESDRNLLVLIPQQAEVDPFLLVRPFQIHVWAVLLAIVSVFVMVILHFENSLGLDFFRASDGGRAARATLMILFVVFNAFYSGALTMFFTTDVAIYMESVKDVLRDSTWDLVVKEDADLNYQPMIEAGDPDYVTLHQKMQKRPEEVYFDSASEGVDKLRNGRNVMHCLQSFFLSWQKENPFEPQDFYIFGKERPIFSTLILSKHSPLTPVFKLGYARQLENGFAARNLKKWVGKEKKNSDTGHNLSKMSLAPGQVVLAFTIIAIALTSSLVIFILEHWAKSAEKHRNRRLQRIYTRKKTASL